jgi:enoyl-CoA hydratase
VSDRYAAFESLRFERPAPGILRIVLEGPGLNAVDHLVGDLDHWARGASAAQSARVRA